MGLVELGIIGGIIFGAVGMVAAFYAIVTSKKTITAEHDKAVEASVRMRVRVEQLENKGKKAEEDILGIINRENQRDVVLVGIKHTLDTVLSKVEEMSRKLDNHLENHAR